MARPTYLPFMDRASVPYCKNQDDNLFHLYATDNTIVTDTVAP